MVYNELWLQYNCVSLVCSKVRARHVTLFSTCILRPPPLILPFPSVQDPQDVPVTETQLLRVISLVAEECKHNTPVGQTKVVLNVCEGRVDPWQLVTYHRAQLWSHSQARQLYMVEYVYVTEPSSGLIPRPDICIW